MGEDGAEGPRAVAANRTVTEYLDPESLAVTASRGEYISPQLRPWSVRHWARHGGRLCDSSDLDVFSGSSHLLASDRPIAFGRGRAGGCPSRSRPDDILGRPLRMARRLLRAESRRPSVASETPELDELR